MKKLFLLLTLLNQLSGVSKETIPSQADLDEVLGISLSTSKFISAMVKMNKQKGDRKEYLKKIVGADNLTYFLITHSTYENEEFAKTHEISLLFEAAGFANILKQSPRVSSHEHVKNIQVLKEEKNYSFGFFEIDREDVIQAKLLYRYDKKLKHIDHLVIAKKGSVDMAAGVEVFKPEEKIYRANKKTYPIGPAFKKALLRIIFLLIIILIFRSIYLRVGQHKKNQMQVSQSLTSD